MSHDIVGGRYFMLIDHLIVKELPPGGRRSGRTHRMLEAALAEVRKGKQVAVVVNNGRETQDMMDRLRRMGATPAERRTLKLYSGDPAVLLRGTTMPIYEDHYAISDGNNEQGVRHSNVYNFERARSLRPKR